MSHIDDRSASAKAMSKVSEILAACCCMVVPALIGYWIDQQLSTVCVFAIIGFLFGMTAGVWQLIKLVHSLNSANDTKVDKNEFVNELNDER